MCVSLLVCEGVRGLVCVLVCIRMSLDACVSVRACVCTNTHILTRTHKHTHTLSHTNTYTRTHTHTRTHTRTHTLTHTHTLKEAILGGVEPNNRGGRPYPSPLIITHTDINTNAEFAIYFLISVTGALLLLPLNITSNYNLIMHNISAQTLLHLSPL